MRFSANTTYLYTYCCHYRIRAGGSRKDRPRRRALCPTGTFAQLNLTYSLYLATLCYELMEQAVGGDCLHFSGQRGGNSWVLKTRRAGAWTLIPACV